MVAFADARDAADVAAGINGRLRGRTTSTELGLALGVAPVTAASRVATAEVAVKDHPRLLDLLGTGLVSMGGLRLVLKATDVLGSGAARQVVAEQLTEDAERDRLTPACWNAPHSAASLTSTPMPPRNGQEHPGTTGGSRPSTGLMGPGCCGQSYEPKNSPSSTARWTPGHAPCALRVTTDPSLT